MNSTFKVAGLSGVAIVWTLGFTAAFLYFALGVGAYFFGAGPLVLFDVVAAPFLLILIVYSWLRSVRAYTIEGGELIIVRNGPGRIHIPLDKITNVTYKPDVGSFFNMGFFGIGGIFGWAGRARVRNPTDLESLQAEVYGTNHKNSVVLELEGNRVMIVTPRDPQSLVAAMREAGVQPSLPAAVSRSRKSRRR